MALLLTAFSFAAVEWHADHDRNGQTGCQDCCVQCCPSHHLAPLAAVSFVSNRSDAVGQKPDEAPTLRLENHPLRIDRPPIV